MDALLIGVYVNITSIRNRMLEEESKKVDDMLNTMDIAGSWEIGMSHILLEGKEYLVICKNDDNIYLTEVVFRKDAPCLRIKTHPSCDCDEEPLMIQLKDVAYSAEIMIPEAIDKKYSF